MSEHARERRPCAVAPRERSRPGASSLLAAQLASSPAATRLAATAGHLDAVAQRKLFIDGTAVSAADVDARVPATADRRRVSELRRLAKDEEEGPTRYFKSWEFAALGSRERWLVRRAAYRHGDVEADRIQQRLLHPSGAGKALNEQGGSQKDKKKIPPLRLKGVEKMLKEQGGSLEDKKARHLLRLTVDEEEGHAAAPDEAQSWDALTRITTTIRLDADDLNRQDGERTRTKLEQERELLRFGPSSWHAATVALLRVGALTVLGAETLAHVTREVTGRDLVNPLSADIRHEFRMLQHEDEPRGGVKAPGYKVGGQRDPARIVEALNSKIGLTTFSGYYRLDGNTITKTLDVFHKLADFKENWWYRKNNRMVGTNSRLTYLALLSPDRQGRARGASGAVLGDGSYMFVVDRNLRFRYMPAANYVGEGGVDKNYMQFIAHSQLAEQKDVLAAGNFSIRQGHFRWIDNGSGHYRVDPEVNKSNALTSLQALGYPADIKFHHRMSSRMIDMYTRGNKILPVGDANRRPERTPEISAMETAMVALAKLEAAPRQ